MRRVLWLLAALAAPVAAGAQEVPYTVDIDGVTGGLGERIAEAARLTSLRDQPPASRIALERRADEDVGRIQEVLRSEGYYAAEVAVSIGEGGPPVPVRIDIRRGEPFLLGAYRVDYRGPGGGPAPEPVPLEALGLERGQRARAEPIVAAQTALLRALAEQGYPLAQVAERRVEVDFATHLMTVELAVDTGGLARFGQVAIKGLEDVEEKVVRRRVPWEQGEVFSVSRVEELRETLAESRLFDTIKISTGTELGPDGRLPVTVELSEAMHRSIGFGADWSSSEGFGGKAFWEHRNLLGGGERVRASVIASEIRNALDLTFSEPDFLAADQNLVIAATAEEQRTDAFTTRTLGTSAGVEWELTPTWSAVASVAAERTFEEEGNVTSDFTLLSLPLEARHDSTDDVLDPTRGNRLRGVVRPFIEPPGTTGFTRIDLHDSHYWLLREDPRLIAAAWGRIGSIRGGGLQGVPADKRFYMGGGGSVRPFGYQMAGPVDAEGDPTGGLSAIGFGGELRIQVTEDIGVVPFIEAGHADASKTPDLDGRLFWGAGLGLRYHTAIGPVRADVAVPLNRREGVDDAYQIYLSLGQAF